MFESGFYSTSDSKIQRGTLKLNHRTSSFFSISDIIHGLTEVSDFLDWSYTFLPCFSTLYSSFLLKLSVRELLIERKHSFFYSIRNYFKVIWNKNNRTSNRALNRDSRKVWALHLLALHFTVSVLTYMTFWLLLCMSVCVTWSRCVPVTLLCVSSYHMPLCGWYRHRFYTRIKSIGTLHLAT